MPGSRAGTPLFSATTNRPNGRRQETGPRHDAACRRKSRFGDRRRQRHRTKRRPAAGARGREDRRNRSAGRERRGPAARIARHGMRVRVLPPRRDARGGLAVDRGPDPGAVRQARCSRQQCRDWPLGSGGRHGVRRLEAAGGRQSRRRLPRRKAFAPVDAGRRRRKHHQRFLDCRHQGIAERLGLLRDQGRRAAVHEIGRAGMRRRQGWRARQLAASRHHRNRHLGHADRYRRGRLQWRTGARADAGQVHRTRRPARVQGRA